FFQKYYDKIKIISVEKVGDKMHCNLVKEYLDSYNSKIKVQVKYQHQFLFFIDRDFGAFISNPNIPSTYGSKIFNDQTNPDNLYITDDYSIENSIFTKDTLKNIFRSIKRIKIGNSIVEDADDIIEQIADLYDNQLKKFEQRLVGIIAILIYCKKNNISFSLESVKFNENHFTIDESGELFFKYDTIMEYDMNFNESTLQTKLINYLITKAGITQIINHNDVDVIKNNIKNGLIYHLFRGHFLEKFWMLFGKCLKRFKTKTSQIVTISSEEYNLKTTNIYCARIKSLSKFAHRTIVELAKSIEGIL
ncbi:MAG: DUF4435 domain-containing protein, partial [Bacteroidales bacterium]|nr:DUF4435 domain-containing protein [Bacteroidales bacterium]